MKEYIPSSKEEMEFLKNYDASKYEKPGFALDTALFAIDYSENSLNLLLIKRGGFPYKGRYALPGGFVNIDEDIEDAAKRELLEETGIKINEVRQYYTFGHPKRDPRSRVITTSYISLVDKDNVSAKAGDDAREVEWVKISEFKQSSKWDKDTLVVEKSIKLTGRRELNPAIKIEERLEEGGVISETSITNEGELAFDHALSIILAYEALLKNLKMGNLILGAVSGRKHLVDKAFNIVFLDKNEALRRATKEVFLFLKKREKRC